MMGRHSAVRQKMLVLVFIIAGHVDQPVTGVCVQIAPAHLMKMTSGGQALLPPDPQVKSQFRSRKSQFSPVLA